MRQFLCGLPFYCFALRRRFADFRFNRRGVLSGTVPFFLLILLTVPDWAQQPLQAKGGQEAKKGQVLFVKNCSPCHGAKAQGGEGPNLHGLKLSSPQIIATVKNGIKGEMPAFGNKFKELDMKRLVVYLLSLKK